jgi:hypothetical protein
MNERELHALLDEQPRTPEGLLLRMRDGEVRTFPIASLGRIEARTRRPRFPRLEARRRRLELLGHLLDKEEQR